jgi:hypothetical protein
MRKPLSAVAALVVGLLLPGFAVADAAGTGNTDAAGTGKGAHPTRHVCSAPAPGQFACNAILRTDYDATSPNATPDATAGGYGPADLESAYNLPSANAGAGQTVAVVDAFDQPTAESDLATYRSQFGLPPCTTANGCFRKIGQSGTSALPPADAGWGTEIDLDLAMVSASCPKCNILLVEANNASVDNLGTAVNTAVAAGAKFVSNSYGGPESSQDTQFDSKYFNHPGVVVTASSGDAGFGVQYPAASGFVTAVGGTSLNRAAGARGWSETAWSGAGSGCSAVDAKPSWQHDGGCARRTVADVSADADPNTGVAVFDSTPFTDPTTHTTLVGWLVFGGTSVSAPLVAGMSALGGAPAAGTYPASYPYNSAGNFNDITTGSNGSCGGSYLCTSGPGYDGPTGLGSPNGTTGLTNATDPIAAYYASLGGATSFLGESTGPETSVAGGLTQPYQGGTIFYSAATGPHVVLGAILAKYNALGGPAGTLGFPTSDEQGTADGVARFNTFAGTGGSAIYWSSGAGAHSVQGAIYAHWVSQGGEAALGTPTTDESGTPDGVGRFSHFADDASVYWTPGTGAWAVHGAIRDKWASLGWERSQLGYPTSDEFAVTGGRQNNFQNGSITWFSATNTTQVTLN